MSRYKALDGKTTGLPWNTGDVHTAKCSSCEQRNEGMFRRCTLCAYLKCALCFNKTGMKHFGTCKLRNGPFPTFGQEQEILARHDAKAPERPSNLPEPPEHKDWEEPKEAVALATLTAPITPDRRARSASPSPPSVPSLVSVFGSSSASRPSPYVAAFQSPISGSVLNAPKDWRTSTPKKRKVLLPASPLVFAGCAKRMKTNAAPMPSELRSDLVALIPDAEEEKDESGRARPNKGLDLRAGQETEHKVLPRPKRSSHAAAPSPDNDDDDEVGLNDTQIPMDDDEFQPISRRQNRILVSAGDETKSAPVHVGIENERRSIRPTIRKQKETSNSGKLTSSSSPERENSSRRVRVLESPTPDQPNRIRTYGGPRTTMHERMGCYDRSPPQSYTTDAPFATQTGIGTAKRMGPASYVSAGNVVQEYTGEVSASGFITLDVKNIDTLRIKLGEGFYIVTDPTGAKANVPTELFCQYLGQNGGTLHMDYFCRIEDAATTPQELISTREVPNNGQFLGFPLTDDEVSKYVSGITSVRQMKSPNQRFPFQEAVPKKAIAERPGVQDRARREKEHEKKLKDREVYPKPKAPAFHSRFPLPLPNGGVRSDSTHLTTRQSFGTPLRTTGPRPSLFAGPSSARVQSFSSRLSDARRAASMASSTALPRSASSPTPTGRNSNTAPDPYDPRAYYGTSDTQTTSASYIRQKQDEEYARFEAEYEQDRRRRDPSYEPEDEDE